MLCISANFTLLFKKPSSIFSKVLSALLLASPIAFLGFLSEPVLSKDKTTKKPATLEEQFLYQKIGGLNICIGLAADIEFRKAAGVSATTYAEYVKIYHDSKVLIRNEKNKLVPQEVPPKALYKGAEVYVIASAIRYCPDQVPQDAKDYIEDTIKRNLESSNGKQGKNDKRKSKKKK